MGILCVPTPSTRRVVPTALLRPLVLVAGGDTREIGRHAPELRHLAARDDALVSAPCVARAVVHRDDPERVSVTVLECAACDGAELDRSDGASSAMPPSVAFLLRAGDLVRFGDGACIAVVRVRRCCGPRGYLTLSEPSAAEIESRACGRRQSLESVGDAAPAIPSKGSVPQHGSNASLEQLLGNLEESFVHRAGPSRAKTRCTQPPLDGALTTSLRRRSSGFKRGQPGSLPAESQVVMFDQGM